jgi:hypothetical protein
MIYKSNEKIDDVENFDQIALKASGELYMYIYTRAAPKLMPRIYFHGNYNRYKEHNSTI